MYFSNFLTFDKKSQTLHLNLPPNPQNLRFSGLIQLQSRCVQSLFGRPSKLSPQSHHGILISQQLQSQNPTYLLYLEPNLPIDQKYKSFLHRVMVSICSTVFFGERINYNRMTRKVDTITGMEQQQGYFVTEKEGEGEVYRIKSLEENRLEIGGKVPREAVRGLASALEGSNGQRVGEFLGGLRECLEERAAFGNVLTMNQVYEDICKGILMRREVNAFRDNLVKTTHSILTKQQIKSLSETAASICSRHTTNQTLISRTVNCFTQSIQSLNQPFLSQKCQQLLTQLLTLTPQSHPQLLSLLSLHSPILQSHLSPYTKTPSLLYKPILLQFLTVKSTQLFNTLTMSLQKQSQTKQALTSEMYEQIKTCDQLREKLLVAEKRLEELKNYDEIMVRKTVQVIQMREKVGGLEKEVDNLQQDKMRLEEEVRGMVEAMGEGARERDRLDESVREAMAMCDRLAKDNKLLEKKVEKLKEDLAVTDKILNKTNSDTSILKTNNTDLKSSVTHYKSVLCDLEKHLFDLRSLQCSKTNYIITHNLKHFQSLRTRLSTFQQQLLSLKSQNSKLQSCNDSYRHQLIYYQRLYKLKDSTPSSAYQNRFNQSISDMIIFEQNDENDTSDRLERKVGHNETFEVGRRENEEKFAVRRSEGGILAGGGEGKKKGAGVMGKEDWDDSSAKMSEHRFQGALESIQCKSRPF